MEGLWPLIILWVLAMLIGGRKKRPPAGTPAPGGEAPGPQGLSGDLLSALQQLKRAEQEARERAMPGSAPPPAPVAEPSARAARAKAYLEERKRKGGATIKRGQRLDVFTPGPARADRAVRRPVRSLEDDDADKSSEFEPVVETLEGRDYDDEVQRIIDERRKVAERHAVSREELSEAQLARRGQRSDVAIGGRAEHKEWHDRIASTAAPQPGSAGEAKPRGRLARFADGSARSAVILAEILGEPLGSRQVHRV